MNMNAKVAITVAGAAFLAACADSPIEPTSPIAKIPTASYVVVGDLTALGGEPAPATIKVCKVWDGTAGPNVTVNVALTQDNGDTGNTSVPNASVSLANNTCQTVATTTQPAIGIFDYVSVTEVVGGTFTLEQAQRFDYGGATPLFMNGDAIGFNTVHGSTIVFTNKLIEVGDEGCTPGYWKQDQHFDSYPAGITPNTTFTSIFGVGGSLTFLQALGLNGGGTNALWRAGAAAYLNASSDDVNYKYTTAQVIDIVQGDGAYSALSVEARKDLLDSANNGVGGCPLN